MSARVLDEWRWNASDQRRFAALTGDWNPIHLDRSLARRELFGRTILHGLHGALRASEALLGSLGEPVTLTRMRGRFLAPVFMGERVTLTLRDREATSARLTVECRNHLLYELDYTWRPGPPPAGHGAPAPAAWPTEPRVMTLAELKDHTGALDTGVDVGAASACFPRTVAAIPAATLGAVCAVTRLVGMEIPGMQSLLSAFDLHLDRPESATLGYRVVAADPRFSLVKMQVEGGGIAGSVEAFHRPRPVDQPTYTTVQAQVAPDAFRGVTAVVIGGSRGLGEATAKLLAAGGARVVITYRRLGARADAIAREISASGGACHAIPWNALRPSRGAAALAALQMAPTHVFYFATPKIPGRRPPGFSAHALRRFVRYYVEGFEASMRAARAQATGPLTIFYPSTSLLESPSRSAAEYAIAKAAGEQACHQMSLSDKSLRVVCRRLPRLTTDQSQSLTPQAADDAVQVMLGYLMAIRGEQE